jgi:hypothetical protein
MPGNFFAGFEKKAAEKKNKSLVGKGALLGGAAGAAPGALLALLGHGHGLSGVGARYGLAGGAAGAGLGALAGAAANKVDSGAGKGALMGGAIGATHPLAELLLGGGLFPGATQMALIEAARRGILGGVVGGAAGAMSDGATSKRSSEKKAAEEKKKRSGAATGAVIGGALGSLPGTAMMGAAALGHLLRKNNPKIRTMAAVARRAGRVGPNARNHGAVGQMGALLAGAGGAAGAGLGGAAGYAVDKIREKKKKQD